MDIRDSFSEIRGGGVRIYPYAKEVHYSTSGVLSMTLEIYDDMHTEQFTFGIKPSGSLKEFLDQIYDGDTL